MSLPRGDKCPIDKKPCIGLECKWFVQLRGINPNTGVEVDEWDCAVVMLLPLLVENSQKQRETGAAVESFRNEAVKAVAALANLEPLTLIPAGPGPKVIKGTPDA